MAIDTAAKRNSAMLDPGNMPWPPDGTIGVADRLVMLEFYSGVSAAGIISGPFCIAATGVFSAGTSAYDVHAAGASATDSHSAGAAATDIECD